MSEKCEFCGEPLEEGVCQNIDCPQGYDLPAMSESVDEGMDFPAFTVDAEDPSVPAISEEGEFELSPEISSEASPASAPSDKSAISVTDELRGPYLTMEQAAIPVDHTGTVILGSGLHLATGQGTRLTDDQNYQDIQTILKESITSEGDEDDEDATDSRLSKTTDISEVKAKTNRPELSQTIRLKNPFESERTAHRLPSRSLSVPTDSASLEKRKEQGENYNLDSKDYKIVSKVGEGGSGVIYEAQQIALRRRVAVKVLKQRRAKQGSRSRTATKELEKRKARFLHEVNITAKLQHPNIIPLYDLGVNARGEVFYAMKLIGENAETGVQQSWASLVRTTSTDRSSASIEKNVQIFHKVCDAIRYAHAEKIVHRDLKPDNVMVGKFGEVLVIDWGMALDLSNGKEPFTAGGTTAYMPPEMGLHYLKQSEMHLHSQTLMMLLDGARREDFVEAVLDHGNHYAAAELLQDETLSDEVHEMCRDLLKLDAQEKELANKINFSSDIYLLGAILYEIAVGHPPHYVPLKSCKNVDEKHHREFWLSSNQRIQRLNQVTDPLRLSLCNISLKALQSEQKDRYQSVDELQEALTEFENQVQSLQLVEKGRSELEKAQGGDGYLHLLPALESFRGADTLFPLGDEAQRLQIETACEYAKRADRRKDFDAGLSILDEYVVAANRRNPEVMRLADRLHTGKKIAARNRRLAAVGWLAAIILPIGVYGAAWMYSAQLRSDNAALAAKSTEINAELKVKETEFAGKQQQLDAATAKLETNQLEIAKVETKLLEQKNELAQKLTELNQKDSELADKNATLTEKNAVLELKTSELASKQTELNSKNQELEGAKTQIVDAQQQAEQLRFESAEGLFNSLILPIPMDLRKGDLDSAVKRLQALKTSDLNPQFKNDWVARHFAKTLNVSGVEAKLGNGTKVIDILHRPDQDLLVLGTQADELKIWNVDAGTGKTTLLPVEMPEMGRLSQATLSADANWLALALDDCSNGKVGEPTWLIHLGTGKRVGVPSEANEHVLGCKAVAFVNDDKSPNQFQMVSVEELSDYRGLKERLQIVTRNITVNGQNLTLSEKSVNPIEATTRDERRVQCAISMNLRQSQPTIASVYSTLDSSGAEILVLETMTASQGESQFASADENFKLTRQTIAMSQIPTSMHLTDTGKLYCGHADGRIDRYDLSRMNEKPFTRTEHESAVTVLASSANGTLVSGAANGVLVVLDQELAPMKRLVGQADELTAIAIADPKSTSNQPVGNDSGFQLASGGATGHVRVWLPESTTHDAAIRKQESVSVNEAELRLGGNRTVTCGAVDRNWMATDVPASAYGTSDGQVYYFDSAAMQARKAFRKIPSDPSQATSLRIPAPPGSFDTSFDNFDSFGIVDNQFVLLQPDGQLFSTEIDSKTTQPSPKVRLDSVALNGKIENNFVPLVATLQDRPFFFTNNPLNGRQILAWRKSPESGKFIPLLPASNSTALGRIKQLRFSPDGRWLAVIREAERNNTTGEYVTEVLSVDSQFGPNLLQSVTVTGRFRVGDPAFVSFSADSQKLKFHFHKLGVDRETWVETWSLAGNRWSATERKLRIDERRVDLVAWDGAEKLITRINKQFYVNSTGDSNLLEPREYRPRLSSDRQRIRAVQPAKTGDGQYVLFDKSLGLFDDRGNGDKKKEIDLSNARDIKVFGNRAIVLDDSGFHLIDDELNNLKLIARRKIATTALSLSSGRLAVRYDVGGLCRIMDVTGESPIEMGRIAGVQTVQLSPDGKWAACQLDGELQIFAIDTKFDKPAFVQPVDAQDWSVEWIGTSSPKLLVAIQQDDESQLSWKAIDPVTKESAAPTIRLPNELEGGRLAEFELATHSQKYLALIKQQDSESALDLWAVSADAEPVLLSSEPKFISYDVNPVTVAFSEIDQENKSEIGTRMIVLNRESDVVGDSTTAASRIFLLADEKVADRAAGLTEGGDGQMKTIYRVFEIEGVIDVTDGRQLLDAGFSGDGRSLLEVDDRGLKLLLSKDW